MSSRHISLTNNQTNKAPAEKASAAAPRRGEMIQQDWFAETHNANIFI